MTLTQEKMSNLKEIELDILREFISIINLVI